jgi:hypothetical protein
LEQLQWHNKHIQLLLGEEVVVLPKHRKQVLVEIRHLGELLLLVAAAAAAAQVVVLDPAALVVLVVAVHGHLHLGVVEFLEKEMQEEVRLDTPPLPVAVAAVVQEDNLLDRP